MLCHFTRCLVDRRSEFVFVLLLANRSLFFIRLDPDLVLKSVDRQLLEQRLDNFGVADVQEEVPVTIVLSQDTFRQAPKPA